MFQIVGVKIKLLIKILAELGSALRSGLRTGGQGLSLGYSYTLPDTGKNVQLFHRCTRHHQELPDSPVIAQLHATTRVSEPAHNLPDRICYK